MCNKIKSKKDFSFSFISLSINFFHFALGFSNRNLTEIYNELELKIARLAGSKTIRYIFVSSQKSPSPKRRRRRRQPERQKIYRFNKQTTILYV